MINELEFRNMYAMAIVEVVGAAPDSAFSRPLSPIMLKFAEAIVNRCADLADEGDAYQTYNLGHDIREEFGLTR